MTSIKLESVSVVVCCFNSAGRIVDTLRSLLSQSHAEDCDWEVVLVDNASTDGTAAIAQEVWNHETRVPLRVVREGRPGLAFARLTGIAAASKSIVSFVDDDNRVGPDWVYEVSVVFSGRPNVGIVGGRGVGDFANSPPPWFSSVQYDYAIGEQQATDGPVPSGRILWGAGLSIRRDALLQILAAGFRPQLAARTGNSLASGDDAELCYALNLAGWDTHYTSRLVYSHVMPRERLTIPYFRRLQVALGRASVPLKLYEINLAKGWRVGLNQVRRIWLIEVIASLTGFVIAFSCATFATRDNVRARGRVYFKLGKLRQILEGRAQFNQTRAYVALFRENLRSDTTN